MSLYLARKVTWMPSTVFVKGVFFKSANVENKMQCRKDFAFPWVAESIPQSYNLWIMVIKVVLWGIPGRFQCFYTERERKEFISFKLEFNYVSWEEALSGEIGIYFEQENITLIFRNVSTNIFAISTPTDNTCVDKLLHGFKLGAINRPEIWHNHNSWARPELNENVWKITNIKPARWKK